MTTERETTTVRPLSGIRVVEIGQYIAVPGATQLMVELGGEVVKVEPPTGEAARNIGPYGTGIVRAYNRGKQVVNLDLRSPDGRRALRSLIRDADVVVHNLKPGSIEALGFGPDEVAELNPTAVFASVSGFGDHPDSRSRPGLDITSQAESGLMNVTGEAGRAPQRVGAPIVDAATTYVLTVGVLSALLERNRTGRGLTVSTSLLDVAVHLQSAVWGEYSVTGRPPSRIGNGQRSAAPAADLLEVADGYIVLSAYTAEHWSRLCAAIGQPELEKSPDFDDNARRVENRVELLAILTKFFAAMTREAAVDYLRNCGVVAASVRTYPEVIEAEIRAGSPLFVDAEDERGPYSVPGLPLKIRTSGAQLDDAT